MPILSLVSWAIGLGQMGYLWLVLAYYFIIFIRKESIFFFFCKGIINLFFQRKELKNLILNYKFFYSQIYLIFCFVDGDLFNFFIIKALNSFLFLSLIKKNVKWLIQIC